MLHNYLPKNELIYIYTFYLKIKDKSNIKKKLIQEKHNKAYDCNRSVYALTEKLQYYVKTSK